MSLNPLEHVQDQAEWPLFESLHWKIPLLKLHIFGHEFQLTKFMCLEVLAAIAAVLIFVPLCRRAQPGKLPRGTWWNAFESLLTFIRDDVAKPNIGEHDADRYVPFLWTMFVFILFCNLLGMIPLMGSPTASISVTLGLALFSFLLMHGAAVAKMGLFHYLKSLWPHIDIDLGVPVLGTVFGFVISLMICAIELLGTFIKSGVLAVRLFANMFAGHTVLAMLLLFIVLVGQGGFTALWVGVTFTSILGVVALSLLELFVGVLQAYIFVFLTALFMGMALHPEH
jgi:F-type H+-transporting ATPase subunit a